MKKYFLFAIVALLLLTGCGKKQVVCSAKLEEAGVSMNVSLIGELDASDKITKVSYEYEFSDSTTADQYCALIKLAYSDAKCSGKKIIIEDATAMLEEEGEEKVVGMSKDDFIAKAKSESNDVTCK